MASVDGLVAAPIENAKRALQRKRAKDHEARSLLVNAARAEICDRDAIVRKKLAQEGGVRAR
jgi:hypothetical protein